MATHLYETEHVFNQFGFITTLTQEEAK